MNKKKTNPTAHIVSQITSNDQRQSLAFDRDTFLFPTNHSQAFLIRANRADTYTFVACKRVI
ncbi:hypothetical protein BRARA_J02269 [Brassica rapa]|uniref:Uncharacterized protein n=1 Tax=Brassica campestris TaxID=3711 RepID=A0A397XMK4_BRACM|nr:hypothetical protein BRARA_J02269 [Brassica rapa]